MIPLIEDRLEDIGRLCKKYRVRRLELFGSAAGQRFDELRSDFDFLVDYEPMTPRDHADCYLGLLFAFQDLFGRNVDLVETSAIRNPYFLRAISSSRVPLYAA